MRCLYSLLTIIVMSGVSTAYCSLENMDHNVAMCKKIVEKQEPRDPCSYENTLPSGKVDNPLVGFFSLEGLCWVGQNNNWVVANDNHGIFLPSGADLNAIDIYFPFDAVRVNAKWRPGLKLSLGFSKVYDWMVEGVWTYYYNKTRWSSHKENLTSILLSKINFISMLEVLSKSRLEYDTWDVNLGTQCRLNKTSLFVPFASLRGAFIKNNQDLSYRGYYRISTAVFPAYIKMKLPHKFFGFGPRVGAYANYQFGLTGMEVFGLISASLLYGKTQVEQYYLDSRLEDVSQSYDHFGDLKLSFQALVGLQYRAVLDDGKKAFSVKASWEANYWVDEANYPSVTYYFTEQDLILYGVNLGIGYEY